VFKEEEGSCRGEMSGCGTPGGVEKICKATRQDVKDTMRRHLIVQALPTVR
jgi:hypothetical protein